MNSKRTIFTWEHLDNIDKNKFSVYKKILIF